MIGGIYGYLAAALIVAATLGVTYFKGHSAGGDSVRSEWLAANVAAQAAAEADRARQEQLSRSQAAKLETTLSKQRKVNRELLTVVESHIKALPAPPAGCPDPRLSDDLLRDWNRAGNPAAESDAGGKLPNPGGTAAPADGRKPSGDGAQPPRGG